MKVHTLITLLQKVDPDRVVVCQSDSEGNDFSPLEEFWVGAYRPESSHSGEAGLEALTPADRKAGYRTEDVIRDGVKALFLVPIR